MICCGKLRTGEYIVHTARHRALGVGTEPEMVAMKIAALIKKRMGRSSPYVWGPREVLDVLGKIHRDFISPRYIPRYTCSWPGCCLEEWHSGNHKYGFDMKIEGRGR